MEIRFCIFIVQLFCLPCPLFLGLVCTLEPAGQGAAGQEGQKKERGRRGTLVERRAEAAPESIFIISAAAAVWLGDVKEAEAA